MESAHLSPDRLRPRPWRTSQRVVVLGTTAAFGMLGLLCLLAGVEAVVRAGQGTADLWLEAAVLFATAQARILADLGVELGRAPFVNEYAFGEADAIVLIAGVFLGLLALAFRAGSWIQPEVPDPQ